MEQSETLLPGSREALLERLGQLEEVETRRSFASLRAFIRLAWSVVEPHRAFKHNWHHDAISDHLEAVRDGQIKRLLINVPPATSKSLIVSVIFPAWWWLHEPWTRFLCLSYDQQTVSTRDCEKMRSLVESEVYQTRWPHVQMSQHQNQKTRFYTTEGGFRIGTSFAGRIMGEHPHCIIIDDPHNPKNQLLSDADVQRVIGVHQYILPARGKTLNAATVIVMQRVAENDLSGHVLSEGKEWTHLCLPMRWEPERMKKTCLGWQDPRTAPGELLWPKEWDEPKVNDTFRPGSWGDAGQFQQRPAPAGGLMFKEEWFQVVKVIPEDIEAWVRFWDVAGTEEGTGPRTAGVKMGRTASGRYIIADVVVDRWTDEGVDKIVKATAMLDGPEVVIREEQEPGSAGKGVCRARKRMLAGYDYKGIPSTGDKVTRARPLRSQAEGGYVLLLSRTPAEADVMREFLAEIKMFPVGALKDQVDAAAGAFNALTLGGDAQGLLGGGDDQAETEDVKQRIAELEAKLRGEEVEA